MPSEPIKPWIGAHNISYCSGSDCVNHFAEECRSVHLNTICPIAVLQMVKRIAKARNEIKSALGTQDENNRRLYLLAAQQTLEADDGE